MFLRYLFLFLLLCIFIPPTYPCGVDLPSQDGWDEPDDSHFSNSDSPTAESDVSDDLHIEHFNQTAYYKYSVLTVKQMRLTTPFFICALMPHSTLHPFTFYARNISTSVVLCSRRS